MYSRHYIKLLDFYMAGINNGIIYVELIQVKITRTTRRMRFSIESLWGASIACRLCSFRYYKYSSTKINVKVYPLFEQNCVMLGLCIRGRKDFRRTCK